MMHTRRMTQAERDAITVVRDGVERPATDHELLQMGVKVLGQDEDGHWVLDVCCLFGDDGRRHARPEDVPLPGAVLSKGHPERRAAAADAKAERVLRRVRVTRGKESRRVARKDVGGGDTIEGPARAAHRWHGEPGA